MCNIPVLPILMAIHGLVLCGEWGYVDNEVKSYVVHRCLVIVGYEGIHCTVNLILSKPISSKPKSSSKLIIVKLILVDRYC